MVKNIKEQIKNVQTLSAEGNNTNDNTNTAKQRGAPKYEQVSFQSELEAFFHQHQLGIVLLECPGHKEEATSRDGEGADKGEGQPPWRFAGHFSGGIDEEQLQC